MGWWSEIQNPAFVFVFFVFFFQGGGLVGGNDVNYCYRILNLGLYLAC